MNRSIQHIVTKELHMLIDQSCHINANYALDSESFHRALLKKYFEAETVVLDRNRNRITLEIRVNKDANETTIVDIDVDFANFNEFLKSCIEDNQGALRFYKNMLRYYHIDAPISA